MLDFKKHHLKALTLFFVVLVFVLRGGFFALAPFPKELLETLGWLFVVISLAEENTVFFLVVDLGHDF